MEGIIMTPILFQLLKAMTFSKDFTKDHFNEIIKESSIMSNDGEGKQVIFISCEEKASLFKKHADKTLLRVL
jgi:hypothetical protein